MPLPFFTSAQYLKARTDDAVMLPARTSSPPPPASSSSSPSSLTSSPTPSSASASLSAEDKRRIALYHTAQRARCRVLANLAMLRERAGAHDACEALHRHTLFECSFAHDGTRDFIPRWDLPQAVSLLSFPPADELERPLHAAEVWMATRARTRTHTHTHTHTLATVRVAFCP